MISPWFRVSVFVAALAAANGVRAADPASIAACRDAQVVNAATDRSRAHFDDVVRTDPVAAVRLACADIGDAVAVDRRLRAAIDLGHALTNASREDEAVAVLDEAIELDRADRPDSALRAEAYVRRGSAHGQQREIKKAAADFETADAMLVRLQQRDSLLYAETLLGRSNAMNQTLDLDGAQRAVDEADALLARLGRSRSREAADVLNQRTMIAYARQDFPGTLRHAEAEIALIRAIGGPDDREQLDALATVGALRSMTGDFAGAEAAQREGLRLTQIREDTPFDARLGLLQNFATFYLDRLQPDQALPLAEEALTLAQRHYEPGSIALFREYLTIGSAHAELLRYREARADFAKAMEIDAARGDSLAVLSRLRLYLRSAQLDLALGDLDAARTGVARAESLMGSGAKLGYWRGWSARIGCKLDAIARDWPAADADCERAMRFLGEAVDAQHPLIFESLVGRCLAQTLGRLNGDACSLVEQRMDRSANLNARIRMFAYEAMAQREQRAGRVDVAFDLRVKRLSIAEEHAAPDPLWSAEFAMATSLAARGNRPLAIFFGKRSVAAIEAMRADLAADRERLERGFLSDKLAVYRTLADWLLEERRAPEAIAVLRLLKREEMYDFGERAGSEASAMRTPLSEREQRLADRLDRILDDPPASVGGGTAAEMERLARLRDAKRIAPDELQRLETLEARARQQEQSRADELRRFVGEQDNPSASIAVTREPERRASPLEGDEADVYYFAIGERLNVVFVWRGGIERTVVVVEPDRLAHAIGDALASLASRDDRAGGPSSDLYTLLGAPLEREARKHGVRRVNLWLDGMLRYVPFAALNDGRAYLVERYEFVYRFADGVDAKTSSTGRPATSRKLMAFGVTRAVGGLPPLPGVGEELCGIVKGPIAGLDGDDSACAVDGRGRGVLAGSGYANDWFTEARLRATTGAGGGDGALGWLHLGTHFSLRPGNMQRSWLMLGDGTRLSLANFSQLDFADIGLVTLSACETAMAGAVADDGREIEGLPALVHRHGARSVVASLWRVDDRSASALMRAFYAGLEKSDARVSAALRSAQLAMLRGRDGSRVRPYYWAAFVASTTR